jgi:hypothetical protein
MAYNSKPEPRANIPSPTAPDMGYEKIADPPGNGKDASEGAPLNRTIPGINDANRMEAPPTSTRKADGNGNGGGNGRGAP